MLTGIGSIWLVIFSSFESVDDVSAELLLEKTDVAEEAANAADEAAEGAADTAADAAEETTEDVVLVIDVVILRTMRKIEEPAFEIDDEYDLLGVEDDGPRVGVSSGIVLDISPIPSESKLLTCTYVSARVPSSPISLSHCSFTIFASSS